MEKADIPPTTTSTVPYPSRSDGRLDTTYMRDHFPMLQGFRDKEIATLVFVKAMRNRGQYREFPQFQAVPFTWDEDRGAFEGPLSPDSGENQ